MVTRSNPVLVLQQQLQRGGSKGDTGSEPGLPLRAGSPPHVDFQSPAHLPSTPQGAAPHLVCVDQLPHGDVHHGFRHSHHVRVLIHCKMLFWLWHLASSADEPPVSTGRVCERSGQHPTMFCSHSPSSGPSSDCSSQLGLSSLSSHPSVPPHLSPSSLKPLPPTALFYLHQGVLPVISPPAH